MRITTHYLRYLLLFISLDVVGCISALPWLHIGLVDTRWQLSLEFVANRDNNLWDLYFCYILYFYDHSILLLLLMLFHLTCPVCHITVSHLPVIVTYFLTIMLHCIADDDHLCMYEVIFLLHFIFFYNVYT